MKNGVRSSRRASFADWMRLVDAHVHALIGLSYRDLTDYDYVSAYEDGESAKAVAKRVLRAEAGGESIDW